MNLLCELSCGGIQFGDPDLSSNGFEAGLIYLSPLTPYLHRLHGVLGVRTDSFLVFWPTAAEQNCKMSFFLIKNWYIFFESYFTTALALLRLCCTSQGIFMNNV